MATTFTAAFGYRVYLVPVATGAVDLADVLGGIGTAGFIDPTDVLESDAVIEEGTSPSMIMSTVGVGSPANIVFGGAVTTETVVELTGLTNAGLETDTSSETVLTYDTESRGYDQNVATSKSWSINLAGVSKFTDSGYKVLRLLEGNAVSGGLKAKIGRVGPTGTVEAIYGYCTLTGFGETVEAGSIVSWEITAEGYGPYRLDLDNT